MQSKVVFRPVPRECKFQGHGKVVSVPSGTKTPRTGAETEVEDGWRGVNEWEEGRCDQRNDKKFVG